MLVLIIHALLQHLLQLSCRNFLAILIFKTFREEVLERIDSEMSLDIFAVHDS